MARCFVAGVKLHYDIQFQRQRFLEWGRWCWSFKIISMYAVL